MREELFTRIFPAPLVRKFTRDGARSGCFAIVQSASISFVHFVGFLDWAKTVVPPFAIETLNQLFRSFDGLIATRPSMMHVKSLGDLYMAVGGVFCAVMSQHEHATEVLMFGLEAVSVVSKFTADSHCEFTIEVGQHIGGPVYAGIVGPVFDGGEVHVDEIMKPTFEIIGPTPASQ
jgi:hypothetical protein